MGGWVLLTKNSRRERRPLTGQPLQPTSRTAILAGTGLLVALQLAIGLLSRVREGIFTHVGMDFLTTYTAGSMIRDGAGPHLYSLWDQSLAQFPILLHYGVHWSDRFLQPYVAAPMLALLGVPFTLVPAPVAFVAWLVLSLAILLLAGRLLDRGLGLHLGWLMLPLVLSFFPVYYTLLLGQSEALLLLGMTGFVLLLLRGRDLPAGLALALLAIKPPLLIGPIIYLFTKRRWRALAGLGAAGAALGLVSLATVGPAGIAAYLSLSRNLSQPAGTPAMNVIGMINIRGTIIRLLPDAPALAQQATIIALSIALMGAAAAVWRRSGTERGTAAEAPELALMITTTLLASYHTLIHSGTLLLPALALLWQVVHRPERGARERTILTALCAFAWVVPTIAFLPTSTSYLPAIVLTPLVFGLWLMAADAVVRATTPVPAPVKVPSRSPSERW